MTKEIAYAIAEVYREASVHLSLDWTRDPLEIEEGNRIARRLENLSSKWLTIGSKLQVREETSDLPLRDHE
jgi:hypothetical protein